MSKYKQIEKKLREYNMLKARIEILENDLLAAEDECGVSGISYDTISTSSTNLINSLTEDTALSKTEAIDYYTRELKRLKNDVLNIDLALNALSDVDEEIVRLFYISGKPWWYIADKVGFSMRQCQRNKSESIEMMIIALSN